MLLRRLLLLPLLAPLLAALLVGAINPRPWVVLQLLVWRSPALPLGAWLGLAAAGGGALSAGATALALRAGLAAGPSRRRRSVAQVFGRQGEAEFWPEAADAGAWDDAPPAAAGWGAGTGPGTAWAGPSRSPADPPPTVSVPFRILRRGSAAAAGPAGPVSGAPAAAAAPAGASVVSTGDGWDEPASDDW